MTSGNLTARPRPTPADGLGTPAGRKQPGSWRACPLRSRGRSRRGLLALVFAACVCASAADHTGVYLPGELPESFTRTDPGVRTIVLVGDIMPWDRAADMVRREGPGWPFAATAPLLGAGDLAVGNLEGPVAETLTPVPGLYRYRIPPSALRGLKEAGVDLLSLANNHLMDCGQGSPAETLSRLQEAGLRGFGAGPNASEASRPVVADLGGTRVAFVGAVCPETGLLTAEAPSEVGTHEAMVRAMCEEIGAGEAAPGTTIATPEVVSALVRRAAAEADMVVAYLHFGIRYHRAPTARQRLLAHAAIDSGADLVVGHHAHFWQPVEVYKGVPILYGLGNFAFGSGNRRADEGLLVRTAVQGARVSQVDIFPLYIKNRDPLVNYQPKVLRAFGAAQVIGQLAEMSAELGAKVVFQEGWGRLTMGPPDLPVPAPVPP